MMKFIQNLLRLLFIIAPPLGVRIAYLLFCWPLPGSIRNREQKIRNKAIPYSTKINNKLIKLFCWGEGKKKALLVHGWASNGGSLGGFVKPLTKAGYQIVSFDGPAHVESEGLITNLLNFSKVVAAILRKLEKVDLIITHSFGSAATILALAKFAEVNVPKLVMITTPNALEDVIQDFSNLMGLSDTQHQKLVNYISSRFGVSVEDMVIHKLISDIDVDEVFLIHDRKDDVLSFEGAERVSNEWKELKFIPVEGKGHYRILWDTEIIQKVIHIIED